MPDPTSVRLVEHRDRMLITLAGEFDLAALPELVVALKLAAAKHELEIDMTGVGFVDSATLSVLLDAQRQRQESGKSAIMLILPAESPVDRILEITGIAHSFKVRRDPSG